MPLDFNSIRFSLCSAEFTTVASIDELTFDHLVGQEVGTAVLLKELARGGMAVIFTA